MKRFSLVSIVVVLAVALSLLAAPSRDGLAADSAKPATKPTVPPKRPTGKAPAKPAKPKEAVQVAPAKLAMPKVVLTDAHGKTCLVKVGDALPSVELKDLAGKSQSVASLLGKKLTVVLFWQSGSTYALEELADLGPDVAQRYADKEVNVIAINERDPPAEVNAVVKRLGVTMPVLLDSQGELMGKVATRRLPRTYLVDQDGKILWFDIEYSSTTRRDLRDAIRVVLNEEG